MDKAPPRRGTDLESSAVILAHNHPSGVAEPSEADRSITLKLAKALSIVEIRLLDHLVVGGPDNRVTFLAECNTPSWLSAASTASVASGTEQQKTSPNGASLSRRSARILCESDSTSAIPSV